MASDFVHR